MFRIYDHRGVEQVASVNPEHKNGSLVLAPGQPLGRTGLRTALVKEVVIEFEMLQGFSRVQEVRAFFRSLRLPNIKLTDRDVKRLKMSHHACQTLDTTQPSDIALLIRRCKDWPGDEGLEEPKIKLGFIAAAFIYGGLHALAWNAHYSSSTELTLWRLSACAVMGGLGVIFGLYYLLDKVQGDFTPAALTPAAAKRDWYVTKITIFNLATGLGYVLARAYLVVESFINLSHLPAGAYGLPDWSAYFPHIS